MRAIDADRLMEEHRMHTYYHLPNGDTAVPIVDIQNAPTVEPERKTGRWINAYPDIEPNPMFMYGICSECGFEQSISDKLNYCPNCGADMRGEQDG